MRQKFGNYSIREDKVHPISRSYKAIVSADKSTEYSDIQEAIDDVNAEGGGTVFVKNGTYDISGAGLTLQSDVHLIGESITGCILDLNNSNTQMISNPSVGGVPDENITLENFTIQNTGTASQGDYYMYLSANYVRLRNIIASTNTTGINIDGADFVTLENCTLRYAKTTGGIVYDTLWNLNSTNTFISNCNITSSTKTNASAYISAGGYASTIINSIFTGSTIPIVLNASRNKVIGNDIICISTGTIGYGIQLNSTATYSLVQGNYIEMTGDATTEYGVYVNAALYSSISNNLIKGFATDAVHLTSGTSANVVIGNVNNVGGITDLGTGNIVASNG